MMGRTPLNPGAQSLKGYIPFCVHVIKELNRIAGSAWHRIEYYTEELLTAC